MKKKDIIRPALSAFLLAALVISELLVKDPLVDNRAVMTIIYAVPFLIAGCDVLQEAFENIFHGEIFDENFLMLIACIGAFVIGEYAEASMVMILFKVGELFEDYATDSSERSIGALIEACPQYANLETENGIVQVSPDVPEPGSIIVVKPGERVPVDCTVEEGASYVDCAALTGENVPVMVEKGSAVYGGSINAGGLLRCRTLKKYEDSAVARIFELVKNAAENKSKHESFVHRFAAVYTPVVTILALLLAVVPSLIFGNAFEWIERACTFLVISCPCALVISVPLGFFCGIGAASRSGILVKGGNYLEAMAGAGIICFDKTGTLTQGSFECTKVITEGCSERELLAVAAAAEQNSGHPIASAIVKYAKTVLTDSDMSMKCGNVTEHPGEGLEAELDGGPAYVGNGRLLERNGIAYKPQETAGSIVYVAYKGAYMGAVIVSDKLKGNTAAALTELKKLGVRKHVMLTGDGAKAAGEMAERINASAGDGEKLIDRTVSELMPGDKINALEACISELQKDEYLVFVGDGVNDAPVITRADVGIAMGGLGSDAAIEAADIVIMDDSPAGLPCLIRIARKTVKTVKINITAAISVKTAVLILGALGLVGMWAAVFADVGIMILAVLNSMRIRYCSGQPRI